MTPLCNTSARSHLGRSCPACGLTFRGDSRRIWCSDACRQRGFRLRRTAPDEAPIVFPRRLPNVPRSFPSGASVSSRSAWPASWTETGSGETPVAAHLFPATHEDIAPSDPAVQGVGTPLRRPPGREVELALEVADFVFGVIGLSHALARSSSSGTTQAPSLPYRRLCCPTGHQYYAGLRLPLPWQRLQLSPCTPPRCRGPDPDHGGQEGLLC